MSEPGPVAHRQRPDRGPARGRVLIVAGSDSGGGAGIQADIKTVTLLGGYAATAVTALTVQNSLGVSDVMTVPPAFVAAQMRAVLDDIGADAVKLGMLGEAGVVLAVADVLEAHAADLPLVLDPVMVSKGGRSLIASEAVEALVRRLLPRAALVTPNAPELAVLAGRPVEDGAQALAAGRLLLERGARAVLVKGGHVPGEMVVDRLLLAQGGEHRFEAPRRHTRHTHGTGCTLASAVAAGLAQGRDLASAVERAHRFVQAAIAHAPGFGAGHGPLGFAAAGWAVGGAT